MNDYNVTQLLQIFDEPCFLGEKLNLAIIKKIITSTARRLQHRILKFCRYTK